MTLALSPSGLAMGPGRLARSPKGRSDTRHLVSYSYNGQKLPVVPLRTGWYRLVPLGTAWDRINFFSARRRSLHPILRKGRCLGSAGASPYLFWGGPLGAA